MKYLIILLVLVIQACSDGGGQNAGVSFIEDQTFSGSAAGEAVSLTRIASLSKSTIDSSLTSASSSLSGAAQYGAHIYKLTYVSNDANQGADTFNASGLLLVPYSLDDSEDKSAPWIVLSHGTIVDNASAPTNNLREGLLEASRGFITLVPDYIGFGESYSSDPSTRIHPYIIASSYASDGVNMMTAAKSALALQGITLGNLYLKGYSEGSYATLALQKEIETNQSDVFTITASAPSAGPYTTVGLGQQLMTDMVDTTVSPTLFGYLATSYFYNYPSVSAQYSLTEIFNQSSSYDVENLFNGQKSSTETEALYASLGISTINGLLSSEVVSAMGAQLTALVVASSNPVDFLTEIATMTESFSGALLANDLMFSAWAPSSDTYFYHCADDATIPATITTTTVSTFTLLGSPSLTTIAAATGGHSGCPYIFTPTLCFAQLEGAGSKANYEAAVAASLPGFEVGYCE